jgi:hypothetical protein
MGSKHPGADRRDATTLERRDFLRAAAVAAATGAGTPAAGRAGGPTAAAIHVQSQERPPIPRGHGGPPPRQVQAYPGGPRARME